MLKKNFQILKILQGGLSIPLYVDLKYKDIKYISDLILKTIEKLMISEIKNFRIKNI